MSRRDEVIQVDCIGCNGKGEFVLTGTGYGVEADVECGRCNGTGKVERKKWLTCLECNGMGEIYHPDKSWVHHLCPVCIGEGLMRYHEECVNPDECGQFGPDSLCTMCGEASRREQGDPPL
jgi:DnaJ-class molecular chaperone